MNNDTIFALSSGRGKSGVAVIRVSGDALHDMMAGIIGRAPAPRHAYFTNLRDTAGDLIDQCLVIYFAAPHSFTGTDIIEIQCHGADAVIQKIFSFLGAHGARMAVPGEFSRRAFYNDKMDLADVDGLAALLDARTDRQRRAALRAMTGDGKKYEQWRADMIEIAAYAAAITDYDADDLPGDIGDTLRARTCKLAGELNHALSRYAAARAVRSGFNIVLAGAPNVGKSSLFNAIVGANRAIVSDIAGTTRDVVDAELDIDGYLVRIMDTAGLRDDACDAVEQIGIARTNDALRDADLILRVYERPDDVPTRAPDANEIYVVNKSDKCVGDITPHAVATSAAHGDGIGALMNAIKNKIHAALDTTDSDVVVNARTRDLIAVAYNELSHAADAPDWDIFADNVHHAADAIGQILGTIATADIMDATFSQLCLGK